MIAECLSRRQLLAAVGSAGVLAGCASTTENESPLMFDRATEPVPPPLNSRPDATLLSQATLQSLAGLRSHGQDAIGEHSRPPTTRYSTRPGHAHHQVAPRQHDLG